MQGATPWCLLPAALRQLSNTVLMPLELAGAAALGARGGASGAGSVCGARDGNVRAVKVKHAPVSAEVKGKTALGLVLLQALAARENKCAGPNLTCRELGPCHLIEALQAVPGAASMRAVV